MPATLSDLTCVICCKEMIALVLSKALWWLFTVYIERSERTSLYDLGLGLATQEMRMRFGRQVKQPPFLRQAWWQLLHIVTGLLATLVGLGQQPGSSPCISHCTCSFSFSAAWASLCVHLHGRGHRLFRQVPCVIKVGLVLMLFGLSSQVPFVFMGSSGSLLSPTSCVACSHSLFPGKPA